MKTKIISALRNIEREKEIKIFYAAESGSRAWGFASPDSDYDVRFLYFHRPQWYFSLGKRQDFFNLMSQDAVFDFGGWDLGKTLALLLKGNISLYEWLHSPIKYIEGDVCTEFSELAVAYYNPKSLIYSYLSCSKNNYKEQINADMVKIKKYLYIFRTLAACRWIERESTPPPIEMSKLKEMYKPEKGILAFIDELIELKQNGKERNAIARNDGINTWIENTYEYYKEYADSLPEPALKEAPLEEFFYRSVMRSN